MTVEKEQADRVTRHQGLNQPSLGPWRSCSVWEGVSTFKSEVRGQLCAQREAAG